jgi:hypothetical protein
VKQDELFNITALPKLSKLSTKYMMRRFFQRGGPRDKLIYGMVVNFIRLVDQAACSYNMARDSLMKYANTHDAIAWGRVISACTQLELCTGSAYRALVFAEAICKNRLTPAGLRDCFPTKCRFIPKSTIEALRDLRNTVQHLEEELRCGKITEGKAIMIYPTSTAVELGDARLSYQDIADCITQLHEVAAEVSKFRESEPRAH